MINCEMYLAGSLVSIAATLGASMKWLPQFCKLFRLFYVLWSVTHDVAVGKEAAFGVPPDFWLWWSFY